MASTTILTILTYEKHFGESGQDADKTCFRMPRFLCPLPNGNICISDSMNQRLQIVTADGAFVKNLCEQGIKPGQLVGPSGVVAEGSNLFVAEAGNHRIQKLRLKGAGVAASATGGGGEGGGGEGAAAVDVGDEDARPEGAPVGRVGHHGAKKPADLWCPMGIALVKRFGSEVRELFVADFVNGRVVVYDAGSMEHIRTFGERGDAPGQLMYPSGVAGERPLFFLPFFFLEASVFPWPPRPASRD